MVTIQSRRNSSVQWAALNPILAAGEEGFEFDTGRKKIGNGQSRWLQLQYFLPESDIRALITEAINDSNDGGSVPEDLGQHVNSSTPHPVYDDGPSLLLLYENAKV